MWRFLLIGILTLAPLVGALLQFANEERRAAIASAQEQAELLVSFAAEGQEHVLEEAQSVLRFLADAPEVRGGGRTCDLFLASHIKLHQWIRALTHFQPDGATACGDRLDSAVDPAARDVFEKAMQGSRFVLSELVNGVKPDELAMIAAVPIIENRRVIGVLSAAMSPRIFAERAPIQTGSQPSVAMFVVDRSGNLIAHHPPVPGFVGTSMLDRPVVQKALDMPTGMAEAPDLLGNQRIFVFRSLPGTDAILALGVDRNSVIRSVDRVLYHRIMLITVIMAGSLLVGLLGAEALILRPLRSLARTAAGLGNGDFSLRAKQRGADEVRVLARILNRMAETLSDRERQLKTAKDVAEQALAEARRANRAKSEFLATMSHEIRTPLNGIVGYTERLLDENLGPESQRYTRLIEVATSALLTVANDLLDFSSIESERMELHEESFSLAELVQTTVSIVSHDAFKKGVPIEIVWDPALPDRLTGDEARLRQILLNLLNNAVKFTREGLVTVAGRYNGRSDQGERIRISITDTGIGIPLAKQRRLFKRFSQVDRSIRREFGGTGLGLAISKRLIELMGGEIGVDSEEGCGSTFWIQVDLPLADQESLFPEQAPVGAMAPARILLAEDIEINQELAQTLLVGAGHEVDIVANGEEAVRAVQVKRYDMVLMDIQMPGMDGLTATRRIRALYPPTSDVIIVAMTANALPQQIRAYRKAGMNDHIAKPVRRADLLAKLSHWLGQKEELVPEDSPDVPRSQSGFNDQDFEDFRHTIGDGRIKEWLGRLDEHLRDTFSRQVTLDSRHELGASAHAIVSQAALLGFSELARLCSDLDRACTTGEDITPTYNEARIAAEATRNALAGMISEETQLLSTRTHGM